MSQLDALHVRAQGRVQDAVGGTVTRLTHAIPLEPTEEAHVAYTTAVSRVVSGGQRKAFQLALAYINAYYPPVLPVDKSAVAYASPQSPTAGAGWDSLFTELGQGVAEAEARATAGSVAGGTAQSTVQTAQRVGLDEGARVTDREPRWRLEPNAGACDWCQFIASTGARYLSAVTVPVPHSRDNPRHPGGPCGCAPAVEF